MPALPTPKARSDNRRGQRGHPRLSPVGIDPGTRGLRAVQLAKTADGVELVCAASWECPGGQLGQLGQPSLGEVRAAPLADGWDNLRKVLRQQDFRGRRITTGFSAPDIELHALEIPREVLSASVPARDKTVHLEISRLTGFEGATIETAVWPLPESRNTKAVAMGVAVARSAVEHAMAACEEIGWRCTGIDAAPCALARVGALLRPPGPGEVWGVLDMGHRAARLIVCSGTTPVLARSFDGGANLMTQRIADALGISWEAAEAHKVMCGIGAAPEGESPSAFLNTYYQQVSEMIGATLRHDLQRMIVEITRSYEYVMQCYPPATAGDLILVGGGAGLTGMDEYLSCQLGIPACVCDAYLFADDCRLKPSKQLKFSLRNFALAAGLALEEEDEHAVD